MSVAGIDFQSAATWLKPAARGIGKAEGGFAQILREAKGATSDGDAATDAPAGSEPASAKKASSQARDAASKFVSELFIAPLLSEMRQFPFGREIGSGGRGEEVFGEQLDQRIADVAASSGFGNLTDWIAKQIEQFGKPQTADSIATTGTSEQSGVQSPAVVKE